MVAEMRTAGLADGGSGGRILASPVGGGGAGGIGVGRRLVSGGVPMFGSIRRAARRCCEVAETRGKGMSFCV